MSFFDYPNEPPASAGNDGLLLADASEQEWATLLAHTRTRRFGPGDEIVTAGAADQSLYLVLEGQLEVLAPAPDAAGGATGGSPRWPREA